LSEEGYRQLRSADSRMCHHADLQQLWEPMLRGCQLSLFNSLPAGLRQTDIHYEQFKQLLQTYRYLLGAEIAAHCDYLFKLRLSKFS